MMTILITGLIIAVCLIGAALAFSISDHEGKEKKWNAGTELLPTQEPYSHVETGPDSSFPYSGSSVREINNTSKEEG